ncbi:MAG: chemotaxis protein CheC [Pseudomonadota bacterium]
MTGLSEDRRETLQEMINIGFGRSMSSLADLLGVHIDLSVPDVVAIRTEDMLDYLVKVMDGVEDISLVQQGFQGDFFGEAVLALPGLAGRELVVMLGEDSGFQPALEMGQLEMEALLEVGNVVIGACLGQFAELLQTNLSFTPPTVLMENIHSVYLQEVMRARPGDSLLIQTNFKVDQRAVTGYLLILMPKDCLQWLYREVDNFLERMLG